VVPEPLFADPSTVDGLFAEVDGAGRGRRIVLVHGFTQTGRCWGDLPDRLVAVGYEVVRVDLPGHGHSGGAGDPLPLVADRLARTGGHAIYLGYSFGARVCLRLAVARPESVEGLVLVGGTPGLRSPRERASRRADDEALASRIEEGGVTAFLDEWLALPLFAKLDPAQACVAERRRNTEAGLAASLRACGTGVQEPLWDQLHALTMPVLCVTGADDAKFTGIAGEMAIAIGPNASAVAVPDAGHTVHLEQPDAFGVVLVPWLAEV
jgi:2-succinyl-6-hydroxy-2,4-cyclohexadiene-1-carboxylate synthase